MFAQVTTRLQPISKPEREDPKPPWSEPLLWQMFCQIQWTNSKLGYYWSSTGIHWRSIFISYLCKQCGLVDPYWKNRSVCGQFDSLSDREKLWRSSRCKFVYSKIIESENQLLQKKRYLISNGTSKFRVLSNSKTRHLVPWSPHWLNPNLGRSRWSR